MKLLVILFTLYVLTQAQLNIPCVTNETCQNIIFPCTGTNCICDPALLVCKLNLHSPCTNGNGNGNGQCRTGTICRSGTCLAYEGQRCDLDTDCILNGVCVPGVTVCRAASGYAWDILNLVYSLCHPDCATCYLPNDNTACLSCADPAKEAISGHCVCSVGAADNAGVCRSCDPQCSTCAVPNNPFGCTTCALESMTLISGTCFCPAGTAWNSVTWTCDPCDPSCSTCSVPGNPNYCTSCLTGTLNAGVCGVACPDPQTAPGPNGCEPCDPSCKTCLAPFDPARCTSCFPKNILIGGMCFVAKIKIKKLKYPSCGKLMGRIGGICKCRHGYIGDSTDRYVSDTYCLRCHPSCRTCYAPNDANACTSCCVGFILMNGVCVKYPPTTTPPPGTCGPNCTACISANTSHCLTCSTAGAVPFNGVCYCPAGFYRSGNICVGPCAAPCSECFVSSGSVCTACPNGLLPLGGTCLCPNGTALDNNGNCAPCDITCLTCGQANNPLACTACNDFRAILMNGECICPGLMAMNISGLCSCPQGTIELNGECITQSCPPGTFFNGETCVGCTLPNCANCSSLTTCVECNPGYYLSNGICLPCPPSCLTCISGIVCTSCPPGFVIRNGRCVRPCPACCPTCTYDANGNVRCLSCLTGFVFNGAQCLSCSVGIPGCIKCDNCACTQCAEGYYKYNSTQCRLCSITMPFCEKCVSANVCLRCTLPYILDPSTRRCVLRQPPIPPVDCPEGYYRDANGICVPCDMSCRKCCGRGYNECTICPPGAILYRGTGKLGGRCVCRSGTYYHYPSRSCIPQTTLAKP